MAALGVPVDPRGHDHGGIAAVEGASGAIGATALTVDDGGWREGVEEKVATLGRIAGIENRKGVTGIEAALNFLHQRKA